MSDFWTPTRVRKASSHVIQTALRVGRRLRFGSGTKRTPRRGSRDGYERPAVIVSNNAANESALTNRGVVTNPHVAAYIPSRSSPLRGEWFALEVSRQRSRRLRIHQLGTGIASCRHRPSRIQRIPHRLTNEDQQRQKHRERDEHEEPQPRRLKIRLRRRQQAAPATASQSATQTPGSPAPSTP